MIFLCDGLHGGGEIGARRLGGDGLLAAPLAEDFPDLFPEVLPNDDIEDGIEKAVKECQVGEDLVGDFEDVVEVTSAQDFGSHQHIQSGDQVERHPADEEGQQDRQHQSGGPLLCFLSI